MAISYDSTEQLRFHLVNAATVAVKKTTFKPGDELLLPFRFL